MENSQHLTKSPSPLTREFSGESQKQRETFEINLEASEDLGLKRKKPKADKKSKLNLISRTSINNIQVEELEHIFSVSHSPFSEQQFASPGIVPVK